MASEQNKYYLMHKNDMVAALTLDKFGNILAFESLDKTLLPPGHINEDSFNSWWKMRAIPNHQHGQEVLLGCHRGMEYMIDNLALSLNDCYWIRPIDSDYTWENVNLYTHNFQEPGYDHQNLNNASPFRPSATTQGELQKRWIINNKDRYLIKGNRDKTFRQSINEVFASKLHELQGMSHTQYDLFKLPTTMGSGIGCISKNFTNENLEFIPAYDVSFIGKQKNTESVYQQYIRNCAEHGIDEETMQRFMDYETLSDFLITNTDRHLLNLGILRNSDILDFVCPAPIFDSGNSMFFREDYSPSTVFDIPVTSFYKTELKMIDQVKDYSVLDLDKLPSADYMKNLYANDPYSTVYFGNMMAGYEKKIEMVHALQKGLSLNRRSTSFYLKENLPEKAPDIIPEDHDDM